MIFQKLTDEGLTRNHMVFNSITGKVVKGKLLPNSLQPPLRRQ